MTAQIIKFTPRAPAKAIAAPDLQAITFNMMAFGFLAWAYWMAALYER